MGMFDYVNHKDDCLTTATFDDINNSLAKGIMGYVWTPKWKLLGNWPNDNLLAKYKNRKKEDHESGVDECWCWAKDGSEMYSDWDPENPLAVWDPINIEGHALKAAKQLCSTGQWRFNLSCEPTSCKGTSFVAEFKSIDPQINNSTRAVSCVAAKAISLALYDIVKRAHVSA